jgi:hypothetical protein
MAAIASLREEGGERIVLAVLVRWHRAVRLNPMFQAVELPAGISYLNSSLANVNGNDLALNYTLVGGFLLGI